MSKSKLTKEEVMQYAKTIEDNFVREVFIERYYYGHEPVDIYRNYNMLLTDLVKILVDEMKKAESLVFEGMSEETEKVRFGNNIYIDLIDLKKEDQSMEEFQAEVDLVINQLDNELKSYVDLRYGLNKQTTHTYEQLKQVKNHSLTIIKGCLLKARLEISRIIINTRENQIDEKSIINIVRNKIKNSSMEFLTQLLYRVRISYSQEEQMIINMFFDLNKTGVTFNVRKMMNLFSDPDIDENMINDVILRFAYSSYNTVINGDIELFGKTKP